MLPVKIPPSEQETILTGLNDIPAEYLLELLETVKATDDQLQHWAEVKDLFQLLRSELKAYFSNQKSTFESPNQRVTEYLDLALAFYVELYGLIQSRFDLLEKTAYKINLDFPWRTPGELLVSILENQAASMLCEAFLPYHNFSPKKLKAFLKGIAEGKKPKPATKQKSLESWYKNHFQPKDLQIFNVLLVFVLEVCVVASLRDNSLKRRLYYLSLRADDLNQATIRLLPKTGGWQWDKGTRKLGSQVGGGYA